MLSTVFLSFFRPGPPGCRKGGQKGQPAGGQAHSGIKRGRNRHCLSICERDLFILSRFCKKSRLVSLKPQREMCLYINFELPSREGASHSKRSKAGGSCTSSGFAGVEPVKIKKRKAQPAAGQGGAACKKRGQASAPKHRSPSPFSPLPEAGGKGPGRGTNTAETISS